MEQLNYHKLINLKKRLVKYDCEYSKKIMTTIDECIIEAKAVSKKQDEERRSEYQFEDVTCEICGKDYQRGYIYKHKRDTHGAIGKPKKETNAVEVLKKCIEEGMSVDEKVKILQDDIVENKKKLAVLEENLTKEGKKITGT